MNKRFTWPNENKSAVMLSFDVDGETTWANGNRGLENGENYLKSLSIGQFGPKRCVENILEILDKHKIKATFFVPSFIAEKNPELIKNIDRKGHEIGNHGYHHERFYDENYEEQLEIIKRSQATIEGLIGKRPKGFRTPSGDWSDFTPELLIDQGFEYSSSMRGSDFPYRTFIDGDSTEFIEIPTKWELDDYVQLAYNLYPAEPVGQGRISGYKNVFDNFKWEFDGYHDYGLCISYMFHPQVIGSPGRLLLLDELIQYMKEKEDVWFATGSQIADWIRDNSKEEI